jgi:hypothetical protein
MLRHECLKNDLSVLYLDKNYVPNAVPSTIEHLQQNFPDDTNIKIIALLPIQKS